MRLSLLYRGSLSSCNYTCDYCPFAKTKNTREELLHDKQQLLRFQSWLKEQTYASIGLLLTPWGEAMIRKYYQEAMTEISFYPNIHKVAVQTNLSFRLDWLDHVNKDTLGLWTTFHPTQNSIDDFVAKSSTLVEKNIKHSVGIVGLKENFEAIKSLKEKLHPSVYLWINAYKREKDYYHESDHTFLNSIDPYFHFNTKYHSSKGEACQAGNTSFSIDGDGNLKRCHFIHEHMGNIYETPMQELRQKLSCTNDSCGCHIGYVHLDKLKLYPLYGDGLMERIPQSFH